MKKLLFLLFIGISAGAFAQHSCAPFSASVRGRYLSCVGTQDTLIALATGTGPFTYRWSPGGLTNDAVIVTPNVTTTYTVTIIDSCKDSIRISFTIKVETPMLSACCNNSISLGDSILLVAGGNNVRYQWFPSVRCLNPPLCDSVMATPAVTTTYTVGGIDSAGCSAERTLTITVGPTGVPSISGSGFANVYPNPSSTEFTLNLQNKALLQVSDITGRLLFSEIENAGNVTFGKELSPGIYFLFIDGKPVGKIVKT